MKKLIKKSWIIIQGIYYSFLSIIRSKNRLHYLLKIGDLFTKTKANYISLEKIKEDPFSKDLIEKRYSLGIPPLTELKEYPKNSVGFLFYQLMTKEGLDLFPFVEKSNLSEIEYLRERRREIHDILHVVLDYDTSLKGEASLNTFLAAQSGMPISLLVTVGVILKYIFTKPHELFSLLESISNAWQRGKNSISPFSICWEEYLDCDVKEVQYLLIKKELNLVKV